jgi:predicted metal-dependent HD superfamily phosphohydrolase
MATENGEAFFSLSRREVEAMTGKIIHLLGAFSGDRLLPASLLAVRLIEKYSAEDRFYHNLSHIRAMLEAAEKFKDKFADHDSVRLAVWFHDAVYDPKVRTNEAESAALAVNILAELNFPSAQIGKVEKMILATEKHDETGLDKDGKLFLDLDLGILGANAEVYKRYSEAIRKEYSFVPESLYREKRREVLQGFLQRRNIYYTGELRELLEQGARKNIANEIKELI